MYVDVSLFVSCVRGAIEQGIAMDTGLVRMLPTIKEHAAMAKSQGPRRLGTVAMVELGRRLLSGDYGYMTAKIFREWVRSNYPIGNSNEMFDESQCKDYEEVKAA